VWRRQVRRFRLARAEQITSNFIEPRRPERRKFLNLDNWFALPAVYPVQLRRLLPRDAPEALANVKRLFHSTAIEIE
jgi:hypothetical protein